jgi:hypothetical protein
MATIMMISAVSVYKHGVFLSWDSISGNVFVGATRRVYDSQSLVAVCHATGQAINSKYVCNFHVCAWMSGVRGACLLISCSTPRNAGEPLSVLIASAHAKRRRSLR